MKHFVFGKEDICWRRICIFVTALSDVHIKCKRIILIFVFKWPRKSTVFVCNRNGYRCYFRTHINPLCPIFHLCVRNMKYRPFSISIKKIINWFATETRDTWPKFTSMLNSPISIIGYMLDRNRNMIEWVLFCALFWNMSVKKRRHQCRWRSFSIQFYHSRYPQLLCLLTYKIKFFTEAFTTISPLHSCMYARVCRMQITCFKIKLFYGHIFSLLMHYSAEE